MVEYMEKHSFNVNLALVGSPKILIKEYFNFSSDYNSSVQLFKEKMASGKPA